MAKNRLADWDTTAGNNTDVGGINIDEGWPPENVNNAMREKMSQVAEFFKDTTAQITSTNVGNAYSITTNDGVTAYAAGQKYAFIVNAANTGAATLNVNTIAAKAIVRPDGTALDDNDLVVNQIAIVAYEATSDEFQLLSTGQTSINAVTSETSIDRAADKLLVYDDSATANRSAIIDNVVGPVRMAAQATTSGNGVTFSSIPDWVTCITVMVWGVSTSGTDNLVVRIGDSGGIETTGYANSVSEGTTNGALTTGQPITVSNTAALLWYGVCVITNIDGNDWVFDGNLSPGVAGNTRVFAGGKSLTGTLTQVRLTVSGTDTLDSGKVNVVYE